MFAGFLSLISYFPYIKDVLAKKTKPQRTSWIIWAILTAIAFFSQLAKGATASLWQPGIETVCITTIFFLSLSYGVGGITKRDIAILLAAGIGLLLWYHTKEPAIALYISIAIDASGTILTVIKSYEDPASETFSTWIMVAIAGLFSMFAVGKFDIVLLSYPLYIFAANAATALAMVLGERRK